MPARSGPGDDRLPGRRRPDAGRSPRGQKRYFLNLRQLPLARFGWRVPENSVSETDDGLRAVVELRMQLEEYDTAPVVTPQVLTFSRTDDGEPAAGR